MILSIVPKTIKSVMRKSPISYFSQTNKHLRDLLSSVTPNDVCIDCGANIGVVTIPLLKKGAYVHAFEPNPYAFKILSNSTPNNLRKNLTLHQAAVSSKSGSMPLYFHENNKDDPVKWSTGSSLNADKNNIDLSSSVTVNVVRLVDYIQSIDQSIKILKIDIEGAEYPVLEELIDTGLYKKIERIYVETHAHKIPSLKEDDKRVRQKIKDNQIRNIYLNWI